MATQTALTSRDGGKYKELVNQIYKETLENGKVVKTKLIGVVDPICQNNDKYIPQSRKTTNLVDGYIERMSEKKEKIHKKPIPQKNNINYDMNPSLVNYEVKYHIKTRPNEKNATSFKTYENDKHLKTYPPKDEMKSIISPGKNKPTSTIIEPLIKVNRKRYIPQNNTTDILMMHPYSKDENDNPNSSRNSNLSKHFRHNSETTYERIFTLGNVKEKSESEKKLLYKPNRYSKVNGDSVGDLFQSKVNEKAKEFKVSDKPNNSNFNTLSNYAKIYLKEKYSYDNNESHL